MSDLLSTGVSGLLAFQTALKTISNNISNANTPGYDQESTNLVTNPASATAGGWIGNGVTVGSVTRPYNQFLTQQTNSTHQQLQPAQYARSSFAGTDRQYVQRLEHWAVGHAAGLQQRRADHGQLALADTSAPGAC